MLSFADLILLAEKFNCFNSWLGINGDAFRVANRFFE